jgi:DNA ligase-1
MIETINTMADFEVLYGKATTGKIKVWSIKVVERDGNGVIITNHGYLDGKIISNDKIISEGKNVGKKNATTAVQQAIAEARSSWIKKTESGYSTKSDQSTKNNNLEKDEKDETEIVGRGKGITEDAPTVMLAHDYNKRGKDITFPCYCQPKLDGTRAVAVKKGIFSRNRKKYPHLEHIMDEIHRIHAEFVLDGELYSKELTFQEIVGLVKKETLTEADMIKQEKIKFHVYDVVHAEMPFESRLVLLQRLFSSNIFKHIVLVPTVVCNKPDKIGELHAEYVADGYEGLMLRNAAGLYKGSRSIDLQKYKEFFDGEYEITGAVEGCGLETGCVIWVCRTVDAKEFHCRPRGTREDRQELFQTANKYIGAQLTVRYQELTDTGIPRFPVGISVRDYE